MHSLCGWRLEGEKETYIFMSAITSKSVLRNCLEKALIIPKLYNKSKYLMNDLGRSGAYQLIAEP